MRECTLTRAMSGSSLSKGAYLYKDEAGEKRVGPGDSSEFQVATSIGAAVTRRKAPFFMRRSVREVRYHTCEGVEVPAKSLGR